MSDGVADEVDAYLSQAGLVAYNNDRWWGIEPNRPSGSRGQDIGYDVAHHRAQVDRRTIRRSTLVQPGQEKKVFNQTPHLIGRSTDSMNCLVTLITNSQLASAP